MRPARRAARFVARMAAVSSLAVGASSLVGLPQEPGGPHLSSHSQLVATGTVAPGGTATVSDVGVDAEMVGFTWSGLEAVHIEVRARHGEAWGDWLTLEGVPSEGPDADSAEFAGQGFAGPAFLGDDFRTVELRVEEGSPEELTLHAIDTEPATAPGGPIAMAGVPSAAAAVSAPGIITRAQWGADESLRDVSPDPDCRQPQYATEVRFGVVHHTVSDNSYTREQSAALIRGIHEFHVRTNGWCDIGYNFLVDRFGQVFEGRLGGMTKPVIGGHTGGFNSGSTGVAVLGNFEESTVPSATYSALRALLAWKLGYHGVDPRGTTVEIAGDSPSSLYAAGSLVTVENLEGHRDTNATECPGRYLYALLPSLRTDVAADIAAARDDRLVGDWDGDGDDTPAVYQNGAWRFRNANQEGPADITVAYGAAGYVPVVGDWDGDGDDTIGVFSGGYWLLRNSITPGPPEIVVHYGAPSFTPITGDWDGLGGTGIGVVDTGGAWFAKNAPSGGPPDADFAYGALGYRPVSGDWDGDGRDGIGVFDDNGYWLLRNTASPGQPHVVFDYARPTDRPVAGDWNGDGIDSAGIARGSYWWLRSPFLGPPDTVFGFQ